MLQNLRAWVRTVKRDVVALSLAARDPRVPWYARALAVAVVGYALSPSDLIPDFIPVLGYLDDVVIVPAGILLTIRCIAPALLAEFRLAACRAPLHARQAGREGHPTRLNLEPRTSNPEPRTPN